MYIVQSLTNCLIEIMHCDKLKQVNVEQLSGNAAGNINNVGGFGGMGTPMSEVNTKRKCIYIEGGHDILEENPIRVKDLFAKFLKKR